MSRRFVFLVSALISILGSSSVSGTVYLEQIEVPLRIPPLRGFQSRARAPVETLDPRFLSGRFALTREGRQFLNKTSDRFPGETNRIVVYTCPEVLNRTNAGNSRVVIDVSRQRVYLESEGLMALETQVSTARAGKYTPLGTFSMTERVCSGKVSNLYGVSMPYWMRLGETEFGVHAGYLPGYPASSGCIRLPLEAARIIYGKTARGTPVVVTQGYAGPRVPALQLIDPGARPPVGQVQTPANDRAPKGSASAAGQRAESGTAGPLRARRVPAARRLAEPPPSPYPVDELGQTFRRTRI